MHEDRRIRFKHHNTLITITDHTLPCVFYWGWTVTSASAAANLSCKGLHLAAVWFTNGRCLILIQLFCSAGPSLFELTAFKCVYLQKRVYFPTFSSFLARLHLIRKWWKRTESTDRRLRLRLHIWLWAWVSFWTDVQWQSMLSVVFTHIDVIVLKPVNLSCCSSRCYTNPFPTSNSKFYPGTRTDSWGSRQIAMQLTSSKKHDPYQHQRAVASTLLQDCPNKFVPPFVSGRTEGTKATCEVVGSWIFPQIREYFSKKVNFCTTGCSRVRKA